MQCEELGNSPAVGGANVAVAVGADARGGGSAGSAGGVNVQPLWDITSTRRRSLREQSSTETELGICLHNSQQFCLY